MSEGAELFAKTTISVDLQWRKCCRLSDETCHSDYNLYDWLHPGDSHGFNGEATSRRCVRDDGAMVGIVLRFFTVAVQVVTWHVEVCSRSTKKYPGFRGYY